MIIAKELSKYYGDRAAVTGVEFSIADGIVVGFLGLNGAGKTTLLRMLAGDLLPTGGDIAIDGVHLANRPRNLGAMVGFLPEQPPLYLDMIVRDYLTYVARLRGMAEARIAERLSQVLAQCNLTSVGDWLIDTLSHGYKKRVGIAQAIIHEPKLVILDEPTTGLDPQQLIEMRRLVRDLAGKHTVLISSHHLSEVRETCERLLLLKQGRIVASGTEEELSQRVAARSGGAAFSVTVGGDGEKAERLLSHLAYVVSVKRGNGSGGAHSFTVLTERDIRPQAAKALVNGGLDLLQLDQASDELENIFLELVGKTAEDESPVSSLPADAAPAESTSSPSE